MRILKLSKLGGVALVLVVGVTAAACGSSPNTSSSTTAAGKGPSNLSATSFTSSFSVMSSLTSLAKSGKGKIGALLPDTASSARYVEFDAPYLKQAFEKAGLTSNDYTITNAQGSSSTELTQAQADITNGATVLLMDGLDSTVGAAIESYASSHGVKVIPRYSSSTAHPPITMRRCSPRGTTKCFRRCSRVASTRRSVSRPYRLGTTNRR